MEKSGNLAGYTAERAREVFRCGHAKVAENMSPTGDGYVRCRYCYNERLKLYMRGVRERQSA